MVGEKKESGKMEGELIRIGVDSKSRAGGKRFGRERWHRGETAVEKWPRHKGRMREYVPLSRILKRATYPRFSTVCPFSSSFQRIHFLQTFDREKMVQFVSKSNIPLILPLSFVSWMNFRTSVSLFLIELLFILNLTRKINISCKKEIICAAINHIAKTREGNEEQTKSFVKRKLRREENFYR